MSSEVAIRARGLSKCYAIFKRPEDRLKQMLSFGRRKYYREFWAVRDVDFDIHRGETVGIVGRNGSGKSTLLQMVCGTLTPTSGELVVKGRVAALLELGAGFNPEFTGRDNVFLNAAILGLHRQTIEQRFELIEAFADIGAFIDQPVKTYSSGMYVRLAFAVAIHTNADILIIDEALAVGDVLFQNKCFRKIEQLQADGKTILFVSHSEELIKRHCSRAVLLEKGNVQFIGSPKEAIQKYYELLYPSTSREQVNVEGLKADVQKEGTEIVGALNLFLNDTKAHDNFATRRTYNRYEQRWGQGGAKVLDYFLVSNGMPDPGAIESGAQLDIYVKYLIEDNLSGLVVGVQLRTVDGVVIFGTNTRDWLGMTFSKKKGQVFFVRFSLQPRLTLGAYFLCLGVSSKTIGDDANVVPLDRRWDSVLLNVTGAQHAHGLVDMGIDICLLNHTEEVPKYDQKLRLAVS